MAGSPDAPVDDVLAAEQAAIVSLKPTALVDPARPNASG